MEGRASLHPEWLGPFLQGFLMEHIDSGYAAQLHASAMNPYSQHCCPDGKDGCIWSICALTDEAAGYLIDPLMHLDEVALHAANETLLVRKTTRETIDLDQIARLLSEDCRPRHRIRFVTSTSFKSHSEYIIMPSTHLIFQNLFMRYNQIYSGSNEVESDTIDYISSHSRISSYSLRSSYYPVGAAKAAKIPAFAGELTLSMAGSQALRGLASMLLAFGEYAGIGIKTSMGMGGMVVLPDARETRR